MKLQKLTSMMWAYHGGTRIWWDYEKDCVRVLDISPWKWEYYGGPRGDGTLPSSFVEYWLGTIRPEQIRDTLDDSRATLDQARATIKRMYQK